jgi:hypothetical protein
MGAGALVAQPRQKRCSTLSTDEHPRRLGPNAGTPLADDGCIGGDGWHAAVCLSTAYIFTVLQDYWPGFEMMP